MSSIRQLTMPIIGIVLPNMSFSIIIFFLNLLFCY